MGRRLSDPGGVAGVYIGAGTLMDRSSQSTHAPGISLSSQPLEVVGA